MEEGAFLLTDVTDIKARRERKRMEWGERKNNEGGRKEGRKDG